MINGKKIGLVLSGGGAKGFAHVGVIKVLEENGIIPDIIVGTSMGSVIGGFYSSGMPINELEQKCIKLKLSDIFDLNMFNIIKQGIIAGKKFQKLIEKNIKHELIEDFPIKYACVSCDIKTGKEYVFYDGKFCTACRASCAMPGVFAPIKKDNMLLVDGGIANNIPTDIAYKMGANYVISVDCIGEGYLTKGIKGVFDILISSFSLTQHLLNQCRGYKTDAKIVINNKNSYIISKKEVTQENICMGEIATQEKIDEIKKDLGLLA